DAEQLKRRAERSIAVTMGGDVIRRMGGNTAVHEASHSFLAVFLAQALHSVTIVPSDGALGRTMYDPLRTNLSDEPSASQSAAPVMPDRRQAIALASLLVRGPGPRWKEIRGIIRRAEFLARGVLMSNWGIVQAI